MRLLHVVHTPRYSGAEMLVLALTALHKKMGHESAVVAIFPSEPDFQGKIDEQARLNIKWLVPERNLSRLQRLFFLKKAIGEFKPDAIFAHSVLPAGYARFIGANKVISVLHDASEHDYADLKLYLAELLLQHRSKGVITVSERAAINYSEKFKYPRIRCIKNGINLDKYHPLIATERKTICEPLGLPVNTVFALQIGRITDIKQQYLSVRAVAPLIQRDPNIHLLLAGLYEDQESLEMLKNEISKFNIEANVHLLGPRDDVPNLLRVAAVYLMPSKQEAHSVALIEALSSGVAVIASNIEPFEYSTKFEGVALLNPYSSEEYSEKIEFFLKDVKRYQRDMSDFDIEITAKKYIEFLGFE
jgi:glycosyltransferase involved in cell wall biosynthesis